jgi:fructose-bisphosphate aldolase class II
MPLVTTASLVDPAYRNGDGVAAFNVITLEHAEAIAAGAERAGQPAILQISENAVRFHHGRLRPLAAAVVALASESPAPLAVHLDHVEDVELLHQAAGTGISSVMFDASRLDYQANVAATREAAQWAHEHEIWIEAELGEIGGKDGAHAPGVRTDPGDAHEFVAATLVDGLAVAVGSSHAMVDRTAALDIPLIEQLARRLAVPLVLHGSSGVPDAALASAVRAGMVKINVGTILNVAFTRAVREHLAIDEKVVDPRKYLSPARDAVCDEVARILSVISTARPPGSPGTAEPSPPPKERT